MPFSDILALFVCRNFAPTVYMSDPRDDQTYCHNYMGETFQWLNLFREGGATLPWSEDVSAFERACTSSFRALKTPLTRHEYRAVGLEFSARLATNGDVDD